ncbi:Ig-like domain-containing protein, partial [Ruminococcaceae bacterium OttesenSCG-928-D13]|nr:Ig-like domain-containing protein [Ruminococcaceae bacterium OttesenSCG-928-D13]
LITTLDLSSFTGTMEDGVFFGCSSLASIHFGQNPAPKLLPNTFKYVAASGTLHHPYYADGYDEILALLPPGWQASPFVPYKVTVGAATGGTATASPSMCGAGSTVTLTAQPDEGYAFVCWNTTPNDFTGFWAEGSSANHPAASFTMPSYDVSATPVFSRNKFALSGVVTAGDIPVPAPIEVSLYHANGKYIGKTATSGATGAYSFTDLSPGSYQVTAMGATVSAVPYYQTSLDVVIGEDDVTDANIALNSGVTKVVFTSAKANGVPYFSTSTQINLNFSAPISLRRDNVQFVGDQTNAAAEILHCLSEDGSDPSKVWILVIDNVKHFEKGRNIVGVQVTPPDNYLIDGLAIKPANLSIRLAPPTITAATYNTAQPMVGGEITVTPGTYTEGDTGPAGEHLYTWYRSDTDDGPGQPIADTQNYTPTEADSGKYIWVETIPVGATFPNVRGAAVASSPLWMRVPVESLTLRSVSDLYTATSGGTLELVADILPAGAAAGVSLVWSSSNNSVAQVEDGQVTALKPGKAIITATTDDGAFSDSCEITVQWPQGSLAVDTAALLLATDDPAAKVTVTASCTDINFPLGNVTCKVLKADGITPSEDVIKVTPAGGGVFNVKPLAEGTAYLHFGVESNPNITAVCRVDVYEKPAEGETVTYAKRHLQVTAATVYNRNLKGRSITLPLRSDGNGAAWPMAGSTYTFIGANATLLAGVYTIRAGDDGQSLTLEPKDDPAVLRAKKYTVSIGVTLPKESDPRPLIAGSLTLTVVDNLPKLAATAVSVNSFLADRTRDIVIAGTEGAAYTLGESGNTKKAEANKKLTWLKVDTDNGKVTVDAGTSRRNATYYLAVTLDKAVWGENAVVEVPLKIGVTYVTPALKLAKTKVTMYSEVAGNTGAAMTLAPKAANKTLQSIGANGVQVIHYSELTKTEKKTYKQANQDAFKAIGFNKATGTFTLVPNPDADITTIPSGKVLLGVTVNGGGYVMRLPATVSVVRPGKVIKLTANTTSVTLNQKLSPAQSTVFALGTSAQGYTVKWDEGLTWTLKRGKTLVASSDAPDAAPKELVVEPDGNRITVTATKGAVPGATYKLTVTKEKLYQNSKGDQKGGITLTIKTVKETANVSAKLSVKEKVDLTTGAYAVVTAIFTNYKNGFVDEPVFEAKTMPRNVSGKITDYFDFMPLDNTGTRWAIMAKDVPVTPGTYSITASGTLNTGDPLNVSKAVKFTVVATKPKVTLGAKKVTMYSTDQHGAITVPFSLPTGTPPVTQVRIKSATHDQIYDVNLRGNTLEVSLDQKGFSIKRLKGVTLTLEFLLEGNAKPATTAKLGIVVKKFK